ncbi:Acetyl-coenzyme A transporter 1 [Portunus trituberculatus]|uniref:Acetyl-coenzyme A transporter 1 n=1 Tax=Portunus trituberculatus TaxID=210409 RepID=A0A5B7EQR9_PORTR|nr:Acetyl-coenzyme A transporter 1 [Portunus trituberculatus]
MVMLLPLAAFRYPALPDYLLLLLSRTKVYQELGRRQGQLWCEWFCVGKCIRGAAPMPPARRRERDSEADHIHHRSLLPDGGGDEMNGEGGGSGLAKDRGSILLLLLLYVLQGIPLGLAGSIPMILQNRQVTYKDQATFSLSFWPFSIKLLWAPLVDSVFLEGMGRRKSWLVPAQYLIGGFMLVLSSYIDVLLGEGESHTPNVAVITTVFFMLNFLAATQDIAVDGWALTMLSRGNVGWASTCNSVGQTAGYFLGYVVFLALESEDFCVHYLGQSGSLVTLSGFLYFWGIVFWITTTIVWILKHEEPSSPVFVNCMFVGVMAFFARISDSSVGGTYMTLLNTFTNLGGNWPSWVALRFVSELTWTSCLGASQPEIVSSCASDHEKQLCEKAGGSCATWMDGYYIESVVLVIIGFLWMRWGLPTIKRLQSLPVSDWAVSQRTD